MHSITFTIISLIASTISATSLNLNEFSKRQDAFVPGTTTVESCTDGWIPCGSDECILPSRGDVCCSEGYGCPGESFCLTQGFCCPNGEDPATCALSNGVTLSAGFNTSPVAASSAPPTATASTSTVVSVSTTSTSSTKSTAGVPSYSSTILVGTGSSNHSVPLQPTSSVQPFLGGANKKHDVAVALVGAVAGAAAWGML